MQEQRGPKNNCSNSSDEQSQPILSLSELSEIILSKDPFKCLALASQCKESSSLATPHIEHCSSSKLIEEEDIKRIGENKSTKDNDVLYLPQHSFSNFSADDPQLQLAATWYYLAVRCAQYHIQHLPATDRSLIERYNNLKLIATNGLMRLHNLGVVNACYLLIQCELEQEIINEIKEQIKNRDDVFALQAKAEMMLANAKDNADCRAQFLRSLFNAATKNSSVATLLLGKIYLGFNLLKADLENAIKTFKQAISSYPIPSLLYLAYIHLFKHESFGKEFYDTKKGLEYLERAAAYGNTFAQEELKKQQSIFTNNPVGKALINAAVPSYRYEYRDEFRKTINSMAEPIEAIFLRNKLLGDIILNIEQIKPLSQLANKFKSQPGYFALKEIERIASDQTLTAQEQSQIIFLIVHIALDPEKKSALHAEIKTIFEAIKKNNFEEDSIQELFSKYHDEKTPKDTSSSFLSIFSLSKKKTEQSETKERELDSMTSSGGKDGPG